MKLRTQVGIVGAGPAGLMLSHLLHRAGIESVIVEARDREYVEHRIRAGVLEQGTVDLLDETGLGERMRRQGLQHDGVFLRFQGRNRRIDFVELAGKSVTVYGQHEVVKDVIAARVAAGGDIRFGCSEVAVAGVDGSKPVISFRDSEGVAHELACDYVAGCDGFHGVCRPLIPADILRVYERVYPFSWLGILAESPPVSEELIYTNHERGFALVSMRSPTVSRLYVQCPADDDVAAWSDDRFWSELRTRLAGEDAPDVIEGPVLQKGITPMRSFVAEPMRYGSLFLAGDSAHIVPPTGAKGMNLAIADVRVLAAAFEEHYARGSDAGLDAYSATCLRRVWKTQRFSWWMTSMLHRFPERSEFDARLQLGELDYVTSSRAAAETLAENYVGLPMN
jgi:p-hydroxybenzoate 3-monooxygenase